MYRWQIIVCLFVVACLSPAIQAQSELPTIAEIIDEDERFTVLQRMLDLSGSEIYAYVSDPTAQLTFFAPTNEALEAVFGETQARQQAYADAYPSRVDEIIRLHIIPAAMDFTSVTHPQCRTIGTMLINTQLYIWMNDGVLNFNYVPLPEELLSASNGLVYPIDTVLPIMNVVASAGDHTPDELITPMPLDPHFGDIYPDAPLNTDALSDEDVESVLAADGRFTIFLRLLDAAPQYQALLESNGIYTLFIPTDTAMQTYFEEANINADTMSEDDTETLIARRIVPGYMTLDYFELDAKSNGPLQLCTQSWLEEVMLDSEVRRDMETIEVDFDDNTRLTTNGGAVSEALLYARNAVIYVTEEFRLAPGRG